MAVSQKESQAACPPPYYPSKLKQWAHSVVSFSSEYNDSSWSANMTLGEPRVWPQHGDKAGAWATLNISENEFIELEYLVPVQPTAISIYETFNPGAVVSVKACDPQGHWEVLWSTDAPVHLTSSRIFSPKLKMTKTKTNIIRLELDCTAANSWCEIDAVQLVGIQDGAVTSTDDTTLIESLKSLVNQEEFSDVQLVVQDKIVYAHKGLLAARSLYFCRLFQQGKADVFELDIPDISQDDLIVILTFIYTNRLPNSCSFRCLVSLCKASSIIELPTLKMASVHKLLEILTCENVIEVFLLVQNEINLDYLSDLCVKFLADHLKDMCEVPAFATLQQNIIIRVIQEAIAKFNLE